MLEKHLMPTPPLPTHLVMQVWHGVLLYVFVRWVSGARRLCDLQLHGWTPVWLILDPQTNWMGINKLHAGKMKLDLGWVGFKQSFLMWPSYRHKTAYICLSLLKKFKIGLPKPKKSCNFTCFKFSFACYCAFFFVAFSGAKFKKISFDCTRKPTFRRSGNTE